MSQEYPVYNEIENKFPAKQYVLLGINLNFNAKYFTEKYVVDQLMEVSDYVNKRVDSLKNASEDALFDIESIIKKFYTVSLARITLIEETFKLDKHTKIYESIVDFSQRKAVELQEAEDQIYSIEAGVEADAAYRRARKQTRGRWVGGGFGVRGAIKGAATAGVMNLGSGAIHSLANGIGNMRSSFKAIGAKREIIREVIHDIKDSTSKILKQAIEILIKDIRVVCPQYIWNEDLSKQDEIIGLLKNQQLENQKEAIVNLLQSNPYQKENYYICLEYMAAEELPDNLEVLVEISKLFGIGFENELKDSLTKRVQSLAIEKKNLFLIASIEKVLFQSSEQEALDDQLYTAIKKDIDNSDMPDKMQKLEIFFDFAETFPKENFIDRYEIEIKNEIDSIFQKGYVEDETIADNAINQLQDIYEVHYFRKEIADIIQEKQNALKIKKRTVLGIVCDTIEEAREEREKVVGNVKFESIAEAEQERKKIQKQQMIANYELEQIKKLDSQNLSMVNYLVELKKRRFESEEGKKKEKEVESNVLQTYGRIEFNQKDISKYNFLQVICFLFGVLEIGIALSYGISNIFELEWGWIIFIIGMLILPWSQIKEYQDKKNELYEEKRVKKEIEKYFIVNEHTLRLK